MSGCVISGAQCSGKVWAPVHSTANTEHALSAGPSEHRATAQDVSQGCCHNVPQTGRLKIAEMCRLTGLAPAGVGRAGVGSARFV